MVIKKNSPKCKLCGEQVDKDLLHVKVSAGYYHEECYEKFELQKQHRKELSDYVSYIYKIDYPTGWMMKQIKEYKEERNYTYKGMELTLRYMYEVENLKILKASDSGLGLVPYYYEKAKQHYIEKQQAKKSMKDFNHVTEVETIYIEKPLTRTSKKVMIDISSI